MAGWIGMMRVRRLAVGESNAKSKLTKQMVLEIRSTPMRFGVMAKLSKKYSVSHETIRKVLSLKTWKHLTTAAEQLTIESL